MTLETLTVRRIDHGRVAVLELDYPGRAMNVVDEQLLSDLRAQVNAAVADGGIDALVLASSKPAFGAGANVSWLPELAAREDAESLLADVHGFMLELTRSTKPMVAAVNGSAFGGALELALGARVIIAAEDARLGLPEVSLGLLPGGGGTQLLTRFVSVAAAAELLTSGRHVGAAEAHDLGLVESVVAADRLREVAVSRAAEIGAGGEAAPEPLQGSPADLEERRQALTSARGGLSPAADRILLVLEVGVKEGVEAGLEAERRGFLALLRSPRARAAIHLFQVEAEVKRRSQGSGSGVSRVAVVGGGQMGAGIAATAVAKGLQAVVRDVSEESLSRARGHLDKVLLRIRRGAEDEAAERWRGTTDWDGFPEAEAVVEAVFELPALKKDVLAHVSRILAPETLLATNTSAISIAELASAVAHPKRFIGMHFFSPVERMPLVELIPHRGTSAETAGRAAALGKQLGKVPITVGDAPGFFTSRVYARWLMEGVRLVLDGVGPAEVDAAAKAAGFPVGPLQAHDEATLELVLQASIGQVADNAMVERIDVSAIRRALEKLVAVGARGRRHGVGFYRYDESGKRLGPNGGVMEALGVDVVQVPRETVGERLLLAFATECFLCWDDGTLCHPHDGDIGSILGIGFPRELGGPFHWADEQGAAEVLARCSRLGSREFPAGSTLERLAASGARFADEPRRPAPFTAPGSGEPVR